MHRWLSSVEMESDSIASVFTSQDLKQASAYASVTCSRCNHESNELFLAQNRHQPQHTV